MPDNLGYFGDAIQLEGSYGMMRFSFLLVSIFGSMLVAQLFELWTTENVVEAWTEFLDTPWISAKKALYLELMLQMFLYFFLSIYSVDWAMLLVIFAAALSPSNSGRSAFHSSSRSMATSGWAACRAAR